MVLFGFDDLNLVVDLSRGDRAFCSLECRQQQITVDERKEKGLVRSTVATGSGKGEKVSAAV